MRRLDEWFDEKTLLDLAPPKMFVDGAAAAEHGSVEIVERDEERMRSLVADTEVFETVFWLRDGELAWSCTCGAAQATLCEHLVASALATWPGEAPAEE